MATGSEIPSSGSGFTGSPGSSLSPFASPAGETPSSCFTVDSGPVRDALDRIGSTIASVLSNVLDGLTARLLQAAESVDGVVSATKAGLRGRIEEQGRAISNINQSLVAQSIPQRLQPGARIVRSATLSQVPVAALEGPGAAPEPGPTPEEPWYVGCLRTP